MIVLISASESHQVICFVIIIPYSDEKANNCSIVHCPNLCSFCISGREGNCVILQSLHQNRRHGRGQADWKGALLLLVSRLMRRLHVAAAYSILHLAGLTLVWYNAGFGHFLFVRSKNSLQIRKRKEVRKNEQNGLSPICSF